MELGSRCQPSRSSSRCGGGGVDDEEEEEKDEDVVVVVVAAFEWRADVDREACIVDWVAGRKTRVVACWLPPARRHCTSGRAAGVYRDIVTEEGVCECWSETRVGPQSSALSIGGVVGCGGLWRVVVLLSKN